MDLVIHESTIPQLSAQSAASLTKYILVCSSILVMAILNLTLRTRAFGNDKHVARLNMKVMRFDSARDWSEPYRICKSIRRRVRAIIKNTVSPLIIRFV